MGQDGIRDGILPRIAASRKRVSLVEFGDGRITLSVSEGTGLRRNRPFADAQGYPYPFAACRYAMHAFDKKTRKTSRADISLGKTRYREVLRQEASKK